ncbi:MAG: gramicidin biosynthesis grst protein [Devosia sp.]|nr:gramicidin biosynthesis grst protein [Devosia sp.]
MNRFLIQVLFALGLLLALPALAQEPATELSPAEMSPEQQKDWFVQLVEGQLSTPSMQFSISNIDGALSQQASIREVTISDREGVWLRIVNAAIDWDQAALFTGRLFVRSLSAERIDYLRNPIPSTEMTLPSPEATSFAVPEFPIAIILEKLSVPRVTFGESVFGLGSEISVSGKFTLAGGSLDAALAIARLDGPGGDLALAVNYAREPNTLAVDVTLTEPQDGIIANLLSIDGRPPMALTVRGSGPIADLRTEMTLDAGSQRALSGVATIKQAPEGFAVVADLRGPIAGLMDEPYRPFFGSETALSASVLVRTAGGIDISALRLTGGQLALDASGATTADGFLRNLQLSATLADPTGERVILPVAGAGTTVAGAQLAIDFGGAGDDAWTAELGLDGFDNGMLTAERLQLSADGVAVNLEDPAARRLTFNADGMLTGIVAEAPDVQAALGDSIGFGLAGLWNAGDPVQLAQFRLVGKALELVLAGTIDDAVFAGDVAIKAASIAPFSELAGRDLSGGLALTATGTISPLSGGFDLTLDGSGDNLGVGEPALDAVLAGTVTLAGRVARTEAGLVAEGFALRNDQVQLTADGSFATGTADFRFDLALADLALLSKDAQGPLLVTGTAKGTGTVALDLVAEIGAGRLAGRSLTGARAGFSGTLDADSRLSGALSGNGFLDGFAVALAGDVFVGDGVRRLTGLRFDAGPSVLTGTIEQGAEGLLTGALQLDAPNVTTAAALLLVEAKGAATAAIELSGVDGKQAASVVGTVAGFTMPGVRIGAADIGVDITDLFGVPIIDGRVTGSAIAAAGLVVDSVTAVAQRSGESTSFSADANLATGTKVSVAGALSPLAGGYRLALDRAELTQGSLRATLAAPTALALTGDSVALDRVRFAVGGGAITASGTAGSTLAIDVAIDALPLSIANAVLPALGLAGTLDGSVRITGSATAPAAQFAITGSGIDAAALTPLGIGRLGVAVNGDFANGTVRLASLTANAPGGLALRGSGSIPLAGNGLNLTLAGSAPLALGNRFVADRGGQLSGTVTFDATVTGSLLKPSFGGRVATTGAQYIDPELNLRLTDITGTAALAGDRLEIASLSAALATGGSVALSGSVGLGAGYPANLAMRLNSARYADGNLFVATASGDLSLTGPLLGRPLLAGRVLIEKADISVPENLGGGATLIDVRQIDPPADVVATLARATVDPGGAPIPQSRRSTVLLDVVVDAPNQIFVRGRGLDVEVGGSLRLTGAIDDIQPVGSFTLNRGRLAILGQRIVFEEGTVTLVGDLDPYLQLVAKVEGEGITVYVTVSGPVSDVAVEFASTPALPQDEVLARLLFKRAMGELTPLQLARLAGAAAELAGGGGSSLVDSLRGRIGLDDLDVVTDANGNLAVQAGAYIQDNIYLGVQAGAGGDSKVTVNLDITDDLKATVSTGTDGESNAGIFYETDY